MKDLGLAVFQSLEVGRALGLGLGLGGWSIDLGCAWFCLTPVTRSRMPRVGFGCLWRGWDGDDSLVEEFAGERIG